MAVFIVLWPYLLTTKLRSMIHHNLVHSNLQVRGNKNTRLFCSSTHESIKMYFLVFSARTKEIFIVWKNLWSALVLLYYSFKLHDVSLAAKVHSFLNHCFADLQFTQFDGHSADVSLKISWMTMKLSQLKTRTILILK